MLTIVPHLVDLVRARLVDRGVVLGGQEDLFVARQRLLQRADAGFPPDDKRRHHVREDHHVPHGHHGQPPGFRPFLGCGHVVCETPPLAASPGLTPPTAIAPAPETVSRRAGQRTSVLRRGGLPRLLKKGQIDLLVMTISLVTRNSRTFLLDGSSTSGRASGLRGSCGGPGPPPCAPTPARKPPPARRR